MAMLNNQRVNVVLYRMIHCGNPSKMETYINPQKTTRGKPNSNQPQHLHVYIFMARKNPHMIVLLFNHWVNST